MIAERTADKMLATRKRGKWTGAVVWARSGGPPRAVGSSTTARSLGDGTRMLNLLPSVQGW
jgi:hypothetical protein